ncbi:MAG: class I SAM-dependent methyltransferase [Chlorobiaceae bacterium]
MNISVIKVSFSYWLRSAIFGIWPVKYIEKPIVNLLSKNKRLDLDPYLPMLERLIFKANKKNGGLDSASFLEIGTGQNLILPIMLIVAGAKKVRTIDISDMTVFYLIKNTLNQLYQNKKYIDLLNSYGIIPKIYPTTLFDARNVCDILNVLSVDYLPDCDLTMPKILSDPIYKSFDIVYSHNVFEHISKPTLSRILANCKNSLSENVTHIHHIDSSDHFSHIIPNLNPLNYYRYGDILWSLLANNRYIYQSRNQKEDYYQICKEIFGDFDLIVLKSQKDIDLQDTLSFAKNKYINRDMSVLNLLLCVN